MRIRRYVGRDETEYRCDACKQMLAFAPGWDQIDGPGPSVSELRKLRARSVEKHDCDTPPLLQPVAAFVRSDDQGKHYYVIESRA